MNLNKLRAASSLSYILVLVLMVGDNNRMRNATNFKLLSGSFICDNLWFVLILLIGDEGLTNTSLQAKGKWLNCKLEVNRNSVMTNL